MPWFPVIPHEVAVAEARLGVTLPARYKALLADPDVRARLAHPTLGAIVLDATMLDYVARTQEHRRTLPGFPPDGVVAMDGPGRYLRFWLPDPKRPGALGEMLYSWDRVEQRHIKDASSTTVVKSMLGLLSGSTPEPPPFTLRACDGALTSMLASRAGDVEGVVARTAGRWIACTSFEIRGRFLVPCDLGQVPERTSPWALRVNPGTYRAEVQLARSALGDWPVVAALRVVHQHAVTTEATQVSTVDVDHAALALYDRQTFFSHVPMAQREHFGSALLEVTTLPALVAVGAVTPLLVVRAGDGDGTYPVLALRGDTGNVGLEVRFTRA